MSSSRIPAQQPENASSTSATNRPDLSSTRIGFVFGGTPIPVAIEPVYRGDEREFNRIFRDGFTARGTNANLYLHANPPNGVSLGDSGYISTSVSRETAAFFPFSSLSEEGTPSYVYEIHPKNTPVNVVDALIRLNSPITALELAQLRQEMERAIPSRIEPNEVKGCWRAGPQTRFIDDINGSYRVRTAQGEFIPNPNYVPAVNSGQNFWITARLIGHGLTATGFALDATNLYREYERNQVSGNHNNTYREAARIAGGWTGAFITGTEFAAAGAVYCAPFTPYAQAACALGFGLVGSGIGYLGGSMIATGIYDSNQLLTVGSTPTAPFISATMIESPSAPVSAISTAAITGMVASVEESKEAANKKLIDAVATLPKPVVSLPQEGGAQPHFQRACDLFGKKDYVGSLREANEAIRLNNNYAEAHCVRGSCLRETGKLQEAIEAYKKAISLNPKYEWSYYNQAVAYSKLNNYQQSLNSTNEFLKIQPKNGSAIAIQKEMQNKLQAHSHYEQALILFNARNYQGALKEANEAKKLNPAHLQVNCLQDACNFSLAGLDAFLKLYPGNLSALDMQKRIAEASQHYQQALILFNARNYQGALKEANEVKKINPAHPQVNCLQDACNFSSAGIDGFLKLYPGNLSALDMQKRIAEASQHYQQALNLFNARNYQGALKEANEVKKLNPAHPQVSCLQDACNFSRVGIDAFLKLYPGNLSALDMQKQILLQAPLHFQRACDLFGKKDYVGALKEANEAIRLNNNYAEAHCVRGSCLRETGKLQEAIEAYKKAISLNPKYEWSYYNQAVAYSKLNNYQQSLNSINEFLKIQPKNGSAIAIQKEMQNKLQAQVRLRLVPAPQKSAPVNTPSFFAKGDQRAIKVMRDDLNHAQKRFNEGIAEQKQRQDELQRSLEASRKIIYEQIERRKQEERVERERQEQRRREEDARKFRENSRQLHYAHWRKAEASYGPTSMGVFGSSSRSCATTWNDVARGIPICIGGRNR